MDEVIFVLPGIDLVSTPSHGGARVTREAAMLLSPEARKLTHINISAPTRLGMIS